MAAINNQGRLHFTVYQGSLTVARYRAFLDRLATDYAGSRVHLIADQHPTHKAKAVTAWLAENDHRIVQHFLPGYAPDLNPVELLNGDTKREVANKAAPRNRLSMAAAIRAHLHRLQKQPARVISFFHKPEWLGRCAHSTGQGRWGRVVRQRRCICGVFELESQNGGGVCFGTSVCVMPAAGGGRAGARVSVSSLPFDPFGRPGPCG
jgi:transposase